MLTPEEAWEKAFIAALGNSAAMLWMEGDGDPRQALDLARQAANIADGAEAIVAAKLTGPDGRGPKRR